jgi:hypothetical protein
MHIHEKYQGRSFLSLITEDIQQRAKEICLEAMVAQQRAQDLRQTYQLARLMRQAAQVERALWRDHIHRVREMAKLRLPS